jgi:hypothetical protein
MSAARHLDNRRDAGRRRCCVPLDAQASPGRGRRSARSTVPRSVIRRRSTLARRIDVEDRGHSPSCRDHLGLTGTRSGDRGNAVRAPCSWTASRCIVQSARRVGRRRRSRRSRASRPMAGRTLQQSFVDHDAPQCGSARRATYERDRAPSIDAHADSGSGACRAGHFAAAATVTVGGGRPGGTRPAPRSRRR